MIKTIKSLFRFNYIRNHFIRYGLKGIFFYFKVIFCKKSDYILFNHKEYRQPVLLRKNSSDIQVFYQVLFNNSYQIELKEKPGVIIDLGANIGLSSIYYLNKYPECKVIAVEPDKSNYNLLIKNTTGYSNFIAYNKGIWNKNVLLRINDNNNGHWGFSVYESNAGSSETVESITLDQMITENNISKIDLLKIDIEGSEIELFKENFESWMSITRVIIIELHDWMRAGCAKQFFLTINKYDFTFSLRGENVICILNESNSLG
ncbi:MAG: FkbM family methyltransferase [Bacteroidetes bacterium]|nr:FkbM family methyltransferase [Bacteroidota bacterium]